MAHKIIEDYYLLCTVQNGTKKHIITDIPAKKLATIFTKREIDIFLRNVDGNYFARESIVGGDDTNAQADNNNSYADDEPKARRGIAIVIL